MPVYPGALRVARHPPADGQQAPTSHTRTIGSRGGRELSSTRLPFWGVKVQPRSSLGRTHLRRLFSDLSRVDDEFERVGILVLLHQLEVYKPFGIRYRCAALEPIPGRFKQRGCELVLAV